MEQSGFLQDAPALTGLPLDNYRAGFEEGHDQYRGNWVYPNIPVDIANFPIGAGMEDCSESQMSRVWDDPLALGSEGQGISVMYGAGAQKIVPMRRFYGNNYEMAPLNSYGHVTHSSPTFMVGPGEYKKRSDVPILHSASAEKSNEVEENLQKSNSSRRLGNTENFQEDASLSVRKVEQECCELEEGLLAEELNDKKRCIDWELPRRARECNAEKDCKAKRKK